MDKVMVETSRIRTHCFVGGPTDGVPVLLVHGNFGTLGRLAAVPGWPGMEVFPPQPQIAQTRAVLDRYQAGGGSVRELVLEGCGHGPPIERSAEVRELLLAHIRDAA